MFATGLRTRGHPAHSRGQSLSVQSLLPWLQQCGLWTTSVWCQFLTKVGHAIRTLRLYIQSPSFDHPLFLPCHWRRVLQDRPLVDGLRRGLKVRDALYPIQANCNRQRMIPVGIPTTSLYGGKFICIATPSAWLRLVYQQLLYKSEKLSAALNGRKSQAHAPLQVPLGPMHRAWKGVTGEFLTVAQL